MSNMLYEKSGAIANITFARPEKLNALTIEMYEELDDLVHRAEVDDEVKAVVFRGQGESFSTGQDLSEVGYMYGFDDDRDARRRPSQRRRLTVDRDWMAHLARITYCSKITIASVQGHCLGSAFEIFMSCDLSVVAEDANFGHPGRRLVGPGTGFNTPLWFWRLGPGVAKHMAITGDTISGREAERLGLVRVCVERDQVEKETEALAERVSRLPADGVVMGKASFRLAADIGGLGMGYSYGYIMHTLGTNMRWEPGERNFFKDRKEQGARDAFHARDSFHQDGSPA